MNISFFPFLVLLFASVMRASSFDRNISFSQRGFQGDKAVDVLSMNRLSNPDSYIYVCVPDATVNEFDLRERLLDLVFEKMRSFIGKTSFDHLEFEDLAEILEEQISYVGHSVSRFVPCIKHIYDKLQFARYIFREMKDAAEALHFIDPARGQDHTLVHKVILLNIRLLSFFDSRGKPDFRVKGYSYKIIRLTHTLLFWGRSFRRMELMSLSLILVFETYSLQAFFTLEELASHVKNDS